MISAKTAEEITKRKARNYIRSRTKSAMQEIESLIKEAIDRGEFRATFRATSLNLLDGGAMENTLLSSGYTISKLDVGNDDQMWYISWNKPK